MECIGRCRGDQDLRQTSKFGLSVSSSIQTHRIIPTMLGSEHQMDANRNEEAWKPGERASPNNIY